MCKIKSKYLMSIEKINGELSEINIYNNKGQRILEANASSAYESYNMRLIEEYDSGLISKIKQIYPYGDQFEIKYKLLENNDIEEIKTDIKGNIIYDKVFNVSKILRFQLCTPELKNSIVYRDRTIYKYDDQGRINTVISYGYEKTIEYKEIDSYKEIDILNQILNSTINIFFYNNYYKDKKKESNDNNFVKNAFDKGYNDPVINNPKGTIEKFDKKEVD